MPIPNGHAPYLKKTAFVIHLKIYYFSNSDYPCQGLKIKLESTLNLIQEIIIRVFLGMYTTDVIIHQVPEFLVVLFG